MKGLKEVLKSQLGDVAFKEREDREASEVKVEGFFDGDKITPLMRAATHEDPGELMNLLATSQARSSLFVCFQPCWSLNRFGAMKAAFIIMIGLKIAHYVVCAR